MKPDAGRLLEVTAAHLMMRTAPALPAGDYEQSSVASLGALLMAAREEYERAAARRVEENAVLRALFARAECVEDEDLRARLDQAAKGEDPSLLIAALEAANSELRELLIELHAHLEKLESEAARSLESEIWRELVASTERRRLSLGVF